MTAEDSMYIPFPGTVVRQTETISTISTVNLEHYDASVRGCNRKCACRLWPQCSYYNKMKWKKSRTNNSNMLSDEDEHMKIIWEYYDSIFRIAYDMPIASMNG